MYLPKYTTVLHLLFCLILHTVLFKFSSLTKQSIAFIIAFAFHFFGLIGIHFSIAFFYDSTPLHLLVCAALLVYTHSPHTKSFYIFAIIAFMIGFITEWIGVNTGMLFGHYTYGTVMGWGWGGVPFTIGCNWFVVVYASCILSNYFFNTFLIKSKTKTWVAILFSTVAASIATLFDYCIEPGATKLLFWSWQNNYIPAYNYACWFGISFIISFFYFFLIKSSNNFFAIGLLLMQLLFFILMQ
jgi:bisanhydrobacterioruberin hydratase